MNVSIVNKLKTRPFINGTMISLASFRVCNCYNKGMNILNAFHKKYKTKVIPNGTLK